jgi:hypothetical protein
VTSPAIDPGRTAYEARFADARPRDFDPWDSLSPEVKAIWRRVAATCRAPVVAATAEAQAERADICRELGCVDKPGVPLRFVQELRQQVSQANARVSELIRMWDPASHTERQELDRMRRGWGPSTPTERERRRGDVAECVQALSIAMADLTIHEDDDVPEEAQGRLDEAYERVSKAHDAVLATLRAITADPQEWPDVKAAEERGAATAREMCLKAAISASYGPPSMWPGDYPKGWKHPPCWGPDQKPTPDQAAWHDNGARDAWFAIRLLPLPDAGLKEQGGGSAA